MFEDLPNYEIGKDIGRGSFASVYKAIDSSGNIVAIKAVEKDRLNTKLAENLDTEISILREISNTNIVNLLEIKVFQFN